MYEEFDKWGLSTPGLIKNAMIWLDFLHAAKHIDPALKNADLKTLLRAARHDPLRWHAALLEEEGE